VSDDVTGQGVQCGQLVGGPSPIECADHVGSARKHPRERNLAWVDTEPRGAPATASTNCLFASKARAT
jgi:hypothetical protein